MILMTGAVLAAVGATMIPRKHGLALVGVAALLIQPILGLAFVALGVVGSRGRRLLDKTRAAGDVRHDEQLLVDLVALGVTAGLSFEQASTIAAGHVRGTVGRDVARAVRRSHSGLTPAAEPGSVSAMFAAAKRTAESGAPLATTLVDMARHRREEASALEHERLERLPVKLLFPLAFLILPGFVLVAVVPTVVSGLGRLGL